MHASCVIHGAAAEDFICFVSIFGACRKGSRMIDRHLRCAYRHCSIIVGGTYPSGTVYGFGNSPFMLSSAFLRFST